MERRAATAYREPWKYGFVQIGIGLIGILALTVVLINRVWSLSGHYSGESSTLGGTDSVVPEAEANYFNPGALPANASQGGNVVNEQLGLRGVESKCSEWSFRGDDGMWHEWPEGPQDFSQYDARDPAQSLVGAHRAPLKGLQQDRAWGTKRQVRGAFVTLAKSKHVEVLKLALGRLDHYYLQHYAKDPAAMLRRSRLHPNAGLPMPPAVIVFHEDMPLWAQEQLRAVSPRLRVILEFHAVNFCLPEWLKRFDKSQIRGAPVGYRHMMRFFAFKAFAHPALGSGRFTHYARMDTDSFFTTHLAVDPFKEAERLGALYGFSMLWNDQPGMTGGMGGAVAGWLREQGRVPAGGGLWKAIMGSEWDSTAPDGGARYNGDQFWNNFEVVDLRFVQSKDYWSLLDAIDKTELMYTVRLGDACIRTAAVAALVPDHMVRSLSYVGYQHQDQHRCPLDVAEGGSGVPVRGKHRSSTGVPNLTEEEVLGVGGLGADYPRPGTGIESNGGGSMPEALKLLPAKSSALSACDVSDAWEWVRDKCHSNRHHDGIKYCGLTRRAPCDRNMLARKSLICELFE